MRLRLPTLGSGGFSHFYGSLLRAGILACAAICRVAYYSSVMGVSCSGRTSRYRFVDLLRFAAIGVVSFR